MDSIPSPVSPEIFTTIREQKVLTEDIEPQLILAIGQAKEGFVKK